MLTPDSLLPCKTYAQWVESEGLQIVTIVTSNCDNYSTHGDETRSIQYPVPENCTLDQTFDFARRSPSIGLPKEYYALRYRIHRYPGPLWAESYTAHDTEVLDQHSLAISIARTSCISSTSISLSTRLLPRDQCPRRC